MRGEDNGQEIRMDKIVCPGHEAGLSRLTTALQFVQRAVAVLSLTLEGPSFIVSEKGELL